ncbi:hypothetical protein AGMMS50268_11130 [Spirochaetia bacterium]|nr:hypothetical protein AGMMS50268_11130 [Spirochaetia bacterium]
MWYILSKESDIERGDKNDDTIAAANACNSLYYNKLPPPDRPKTKSQTVLFLKYA